MKEYEIAQVALELWHRVAASPSYHPTVDPDYYTCVRTVRYAHGIEEPKREEK